ncbi:MAG: PPK2 family polyphosphate kinase [Gemmatimonadales bacterium]
MRPKLEPLINPATVVLSDAMAAGPDGLPKGDDADDRLKKYRKRLEELVLALGAEGKRSLLVVLQGRDCAGKDGVIKSVFGDLNPAYCQVSSFKRPTPIELRHDFLWRVHQVTPPAGVVGVFNRSHYEDVLVVRVHELVPATLWRKRYRHINEFERTLTDHGVTILKFMLHISREEQRERLEDRLADPTKNWKFEVGDLKERGFWDDYTAAYQDMLAETSTEWAPWYVVPADRKSVRDQLIADVVVRALEEMSPAYPEAAPEVLSYRGKIT